MTTPMHLSEPPPSNAGAPLRVVVADDSTAMRTLVGLTLSPKRGFAIVGEATNGVEALAMTETQQPDCVVLDIQMPVMGGLEALGQLHQRFPSVAVVMLCGALTEDLTATVHGAGAAAALDKTAGFSQLPATVRRVASKGPEVATVSPASISRDVSAPRPRSQSSETETHVAAPPAITPAEELRRLEYAVSHDLGEPLRIMAGFSRLLRDRYSDTLDDSGQAFVGHIAEAADRMQSMFDDLLAYSRAGKAVTHPQQVDVTQLASQLRAELSAHASPRPISYAVADLPSVVADPDMLRTALRQVIANGFVFNKSDLPAVEVTGRLDGDRAVLMIEDNGIGLDPKESERAFGLFQRLNTREEFPGNGMGLSLCRRLLARQGGSIHLDSEPGTGTRVTLTMPTHMHPEGGSP